jgi:hypothetical protein
MWVRDCTNNNPVGLYDRRRRERLRTMDFAIKALADHITRLQRERDHLIYLREHGHANYAEQIDSTARELADCEQGLAFLKTKHQPAVCN